MRHPAVTVLGILVVVSFVALVVLWPERRSLPKGVETADAADARDLGQDPAPSGLHLVLRPDPRCESPGRRVEIQWQTGEGSEVQTLAVELVSGASFTVALEPNTKGTLSVLATDLCFPNGAQTMEVRQPPTDDAYQVPLCPRRMVQLTVLDERTGEPLAGAVPYSADQGLPLQWWPTEPCEPQDGAPRTDRSGSMMLPFRSDTVEAVYVLLDSYLPGAILWPPFDDRARELYLRRLEDRCQFDVKVRDARGRPIGALEVTLRAGDPPAEPSPNPASEGLETLIQLPPASFRERWVQIRGPGEVELTWPSRASATLELEGSGRLLGQIPIPAGERFPGSRTELSRDLENVQFFSIQVVDDHGPVADLPLELLHRTGPRSHRRLAGMRTDEDGLASLLVEEPSAADLFVVARGTRHPQAILRIDSDRLQVQRFELGTAGTLEATVPGGREATEELQFFQLCDRDSGVLFATTRLDDLDRLRFQRIPVERPLVLLRGADPLLAESIRDDLVIPADPATLTCEVEVPVDR